MLKRIGDKKLFVSCFKLAHGFDDFPPLCLKGELCGLRTNGVEFIELLRQQGCDIHSPLEFTDYPTIEKSIDESDAFIALVD